MEKTKSICFLQLLSDWILIVIIFDLYYVLAPAWDVRTEYIELFTILLKQN